MAASASAAFRPCRRRGARASLEDNPNWRVVAEARDGREAVEKANEFAPEVAINIQIGDENVVFGKVYLGERITNACDRRYFSSESELHWVLSQRVDVVLELAVRGAEAPIMRVVAEGRNNEGILRSHWQDRRLIG